MATQLNRLKNDEATLLERRAGIRTRTVYRAAKIVSEHDAGLCWILNLSDGGVMVETGLSLKVEDKISLELAASILLDGTIIWLDGGRAGIALDRPIDSFGVLKRLAEYRRNGRWRPARLPVNKLVEVRSGLGASILRLQDVSQLGLQLRDSGNLGPGMQIRVQLRGDLIVHGVVRWKEDHIVGVELLSMIAIYDLMSARAFEEG